jgi:hypothetical protein
MDEKGVVVIDSIIPADPHCGDEVTVRFRSIGGPGKGVAVQLWRQDSHGDLSLITSGLVTESELEDGFGFYTFQYPNGEKNGSQALVVRLWNEVGSLTEHKWSAGN